jgi:hypothetical protein
MNWAGINPRPLNEQNVAERDGRRTPIKLVPIYETLKRFLILPWLELQPLNQLNEAEWVAVEYRLKLFPVHETLERILH